MAFSRFVQFQVTVDAGLPVSSQTSVSYNGVTFHFDRAVPVGHFVTGEPFAVSSGPFAITSITPASADINADGHVGHGAMRDPYIQAAQGFDSYIGNSVTGPMRFGNTAYDPALNVDPAVGGTIPIAGGEETSIVKSVRRAATTSPESWQTVDRYVPLHVIADVPPAGAYPPAASAPVKRIWTRADINWGALRTIGMPASFGTSVANAMAKVPDNLGLFGVGGERLRRFRLDIALGTTSTNYSANVAPGYARLMMLLHSDAITAAERQTIADRVILLGLQVYGIAAAGGSGLSAGAGQGGGIHPWLYYAAFLLNDPTLLEAAKSTPTQMTSAVWATEADVGRAAPGKSGASAQTFFDEHVGVPFVIPDEYGSNLDTRYGVIAGLIVANEILAVSLLQGGPGGVSGVDALLDGGPLSPANPRAAELAFIDRYRTWTPWIMGAYDPGGSWRDLYDLVRPIVGPAPWTGVPDQVHRSGWFSAGDGSIAWNIQTYDYATEPVTRRDLRYSLDGVQWVEVPDVVAAGSISGLRKGVVHWVGIRQVSASGAGLWSPNYPGGLPIDSGDHRNRVTTSGTEAASAPSYASGVLPQIHVRLHPAWNYKVWSPAPGVLDVNDTQLAAGVGYPTGFPAPAFAFQWKRDGVPIAGATAQIYDRTPADAGAVLSCDVTATNASGAVTVEAAGVTCPAIQAPPPGWLIDTDFRGTFVIDYAPEFSGIAVSAGNIVLEPEKTFETSLDYSYGALQLNKDSSYPSMRMPMTRPLVAGQAYAVSAEIVAAGASNWTGPGIRFDVRNAANGASYFNGNTSGTAFGEIVYEVSSVTSIYGGTLTVDYDADGDVGIIRVECTFVAPASGLAAEVYLQNRTASGGGGGGSPRLTRLAIRPV